MTYAALALAVLAFLLALAKGKRLAKLEEELSRMKALEYSYRELRKDLDGKLQITRQHLALVSGGKKLPADAIMAGKPPEELSSEDEIMQAIKATIEGHKIAIFMKGTPEAPQCGFSAGVVDVFNEMKVPFVGVNAVAALIVFQAAQALPGVMARQRFSRRSSLSRRNW